MPARRLSKMAPILGDTPTRRGEARSPTPMARTAIPTSPVSPPAGPWASLSLPSRSALVKGPTTPPSAPPKGPVMPQAPIEKAGVRATLMAIPGMKALAERVVGPAK
ncbi:hypothetical protein D3C87_1810070 [compost metagenome]